jgi:hypothetical protein
MMMYLLISHAFANGGPVEIADPSLVGGVVLKQATSVSLISEKLKITVIDRGHYTVDAQYILNSEAEEKVQYGIPLEWSKEFYSDEYITENLTVQLGVETHRCTNFVKADPDLKTADETSEYGSGWCLINMTIPKGDNIPLRLQYTGDLQRYDSATNKSMAVDYTPRILNYALFPAGYWSGNAKKLDIVLDMGDMAPYATLNFVNSASFEAPHSKSKGVYSWSYTDVDLKRLATLSVKFDMEPMLEHEDMLARIQQSKYKGSFKFSASSTLPDQGSKHYGVANLTDGKLDTAWCEGKDGNGVGESLQVIVSPDPSTDRGGLWALAIAPGYASSAKSWTSNGRAKSFKVSLCNSDSVQTLSVKPTSWNHSLQLLEPQEYHDGKMVETVQDLLREQKAVCLNISFASVEEGKYADACISELHFLASWE